MIFKLLVASLNSDILVGFLSIFYSFYNSLGSSLPINPKSFYFFYASFIIFWYSCVILSNFSEFNFCYNFYKYCWCFNLASNFSFLFFLISNSSNSSLDILDAFENILLVVIAESQVLFEIDEIIEFLSTKPHFYFFKHYGSSKSS